MVQGCDIGKEQNSKQQLDRLAAVSFFYRRAKCFLGLQFVLTVPAALVLATIIFLIPDAKGWTTFYALTVALLDTLLLDRVQTRYKWLGARTQELFDTELLRLPWNKLRAESKPDSEDVVQATAKFTNRQGLERLRDWYPPVAGQLPLPLARLICQRANTWWDAKLRKKYANTLMFMLVVSVVLVFALSLFSGQTVEEMVLSVYVPIAPAILWSVREIRRQHEAAESLDKLRTYVEGIWGDVLSRELDPATLITDSRQIQDSIFDGRYRNPLIFDWINRLVRSTQQTSMNVKAQELVAEARSSQGYIAYRRQNLRDSPKQF